MLNIFIKNIQKYQSLPSNKEKKVQCNFRIMEKEPKLRA